MPRFYRGARVRDRGKLRKRKERAGRDRSSGPAWYQFEFDYFRSFSADVAEVPAFDLGGAVFDGATSGATPSILPTLSLPARVTSAWKTSSGVVSDSQRTEPSHMST